MHFKNMRNSASFEFGPLNYHARKAQDSERGNEKHTEQTIPHSNRGNEVAACMTGAGGEKGEGVGCSL